MHMHEKKLKAFLKYMHKQAQSSLLITFTLMPRTDRGIFLESTNAEWRKRLCLQGCHISLANLREVLQMQENMDRLNIKHIRHNHGTEK